MAKKNDKRIDDFRDKGLDFVKEHFSEMVNAFEYYMSTPESYDKGVALYLKLADKVIPSMATQQADTEKGEEKPAWQQKIEKSKKTYENESK